MQCRCPAAGGCQDGGCVRAEPLLDWACGVYFKQQELKGMKPEALFYKKGHLSDFLMQKKNTLQKQVLMTNDMTAFHSK